MRILIRKNIDNTGPAVLIDNVFSYADPKRGREHYDNIKLALLSMISSEMELVYENPAHNYLDILVTKKTV